MIKLKRIYDKPDPADGYRVLVDRLWPRGITKEKALVDRWMREIAPSGALRKWYRHDPVKWNEFVEKYKAELSEVPDAVNQLKEIIRSHKSVTFLYSSKEMKYNNAVALKKILVFTLFIPLFICSFSYFTGF